MSSFPADSYTDAMVDDYRGRVEPATSLLDQFADDLVDQLDVGGGNGFPWWSGYSDWKTLTLIADYLIQAVRGASESLVAASLSATEHAHLRFWRQSKATGTWGKLDRQGTASADDYVQAMIDPKDDLKAAMTAEHTLYHLAQTLDRLAIALLVVGGIQVKDVARSDWGTVETVKKVLDSVPVRGANKPRVEPEGSQGREFQARLLSSLDNLDRYGPADWLAWLRETRNASTHRAPGVKWTVLDRKRRLVSPLYQQPKWSEVQTFVYAAKPGPEGALLQEDSAVTLDGLCKSVTRFVADLAKAMTECWDARQRAPELIVQHGRLWPDLEPATSRLRFRGYSGGGTIRLIKGSKLRLNEKDGIRFRAARILDTDRNRWFQ